MFDFSDLLDNLNKFFIDNSQSASAKECKEKFIKMLDSFLINEDAKTSPVYFEIAQKRNSVSQCSPFDFIINYGVNTEEKRLDYKIDFYKSMLQLNNIKKKSTDDNISVYFEKMKYYSQLKESWEKLSTSDKIKIKIFTGIYCGDTVVDKIDLVQIDNYFEDRMFSSEYELEMINKYSANKAKKDKKEEMINSLTDQLKLVIDEKNYNYYGYNNALCDANENIDDKEIPSLARTYKQTMLDWLSYYIKHHENNKDENYEFAVNERKLISNLDPLEFFIYYAVNPEESRLDNSIKNYIEELTLSMTNEYDYNPNNGLHKSIAYMMIAKNEWNKLSLDEKIKSKMYILENFDGRIYYDPKVVTPTYFCDTLFRSNIFFSGNNYGKDMEQSINIFEKKQYETAMNNYYNKEKNIDQ